MLVQLNNMKGRTMPSSCFLKRLPLFVEHKKTTDCWLWTGTKDKDGYGLFNANGTKYRAHRVSLVAFGMKLKTHEYACHLCDERSCVNPFHLYSGNQFDNMNDQREKKTHCRNGHRYIDENIQKLKSGKRRCKICVNKRMKEFLIRQNKGV